MRREKTTDRRAALYKKRKDGVPEVQPTKPDTEQGLEAEEDSNAERKTLTGLSLCQCRKEML